MRKKRLFMLPCMAAVAIAAVVGTKTLKSNVNGASSLLMQNVEALTNGEDGGVDCGGQGYTTYYMEAPYPWSTKEEFTFCTKGCPPKKGYKPTGSC